MWWYNLNELKLNNFFKSEQLLWLYFKCLVAMCGCHTWHYREGHFPRLWQVPLDRSVLERGERAQSKCPRNQEHPLNLTFRIVSSSSPGVWQMQVCCTFREISTQRPNNRTSPSSRRWSLRNLQLCSLLEWKGNLSYPRAGFWNDILKEKSFFQKAWRYKHIFSLQRKPGGRHCLPCLRDKNLKIEWRYWTACWLTQRLCPDAF